MDENSERSQARPQTTERPPLPKDFRAVVMYGMSKEEALAVMNAVKAISAPMRDTAFAMTTETNIAWPLGRLIAELGEEHRMMKEWNAARQARPS